MSPETQRAQFMPVDSAILLNRPEAEQRQQRLQYLAGYFDAAASVTIDHSISGWYKGKPTHSFILRLDIARVQPEAISLMQEVFPAYKGNKDTSDLKRTRWYAKSGRAMEVLDTLTPYLKIKREQVKLARKFCGAAGNRATEDSLKFKEEMSRLNHTEISSVKIPIEAPYIAGFFDAHGAINVYPDSRDNHMTLEVDMSTKHRAFIAALAHQLGRSPEKSGYDIRITVNKTKDFLTLILPFLVIQKRSAELALQFQDNRTPPVLQRDTEQRLARERQIIAQLEEEFKRIGKKRRKVKRGLL